MTRISIAMVMIAAVLFAAPALASVPYPPNCSVAWTTAAVDTGVVLCPKGDGNSLFVTVMDQYGAAMNGVTVTATFADPRVILGAAVTGVTNVAGQVTLTIKAGVNATASTIAVSSLVTVVAGVTPIWTDTYFIYSPDLNGTLTVNSLDATIFNGAWQTTMKDHRSNFKRTDAIVNSLDATIFNGHWQHVYTP